MLLYFAYLLIFSGSYHVLSMDMIENSCSSQCEANDPTSGPVNLFSMYQNFDYSNLQLEEFCNMMNETNDCYEKCKPKHSKYAFSKQYELAKYICQETKFSQYLPCYATITNDVFMSCHDKENRINCANDKENLSILKHSFNMMDSIGAFCSYLTCFYNCRRPTLIEKCGPEADEVMKLFFNAVWEMQTKYFYDGVIMSEYVSCNV